MVKIVLQIIRFVLKFFLNAYDTVLKKLWLYEVKSIVSVYEGTIYVGNRTKLTSNTHLEKNVSFNGMKILGHGKVYISSWFHSGSGCLMITSIHDYDNGDSIPYDSKTDIHKDIFIEPCVWLGNNVTILGGVRIGEGAIIQAGAVVVSDIPKYAIAGGSPAKVFKYRDIVHYENLKEQGKFH